MFVRLSSHRPNEIAFNSHSVTSYILTTWDISTNSPLLPLSLSRSPSLILSFSHTHKCMNHMFQHSVNAREERFFSLAFFIFFNALYQFIGWNSFPYFSHLSCSIGARPAHGTVRTNCRARTPYWCEPKAKSQCIIGRLHENQFHRKFLVHRISACARSNKFDHNGHALGEM